MLKNVNNEPLELSSLLVHVDIAFQAPTADYQSLQELRAQIRQHQQARDDLVHEKAKGGAAFDVVYDLFYSASLCLSPR